MEIKRKEYIIDRFIKPLIEIDEQVSWINNGGCGIFARALSKALKELNIKHTIIGRYVGGKAKDSWLRYINTGDEKHIHNAVPTHIMIKIDEYYVDSEGIVNHKITKHCRTMEFSLDELDLLIEKGSWNNMFKRENESTIQALLDISLYQVQMELDEIPQTT